MHDFTPVSALEGGALIGLAALLYLLSTGRYAGISGIFRSAVFGAVDRWLDVLFVVGLVLGGLLWFHFGTAGQQVWAPPLWAMCAGGVLVGFGTALGGGCTSGHGVCGLGRLSLRSFVAVCAFLLAGIATVFVLHRFGVVA